jgi:hypothetical protein
MRSWNSLFGFNVSVMMDPISLESNVVKSLDYCKGEMRIGPKRREHDDE